MRLKTLKKPKVHSKSYKCNETYAPSPCKTFSVESTTSKNVKESNCCQRASQILCCAAFGWAESNPAKRAKRNPVTSGIPKCWGSTLNWMKIVCTCRNWWWMGRGPTTRAACIRNRRISNWRNRNRKYSASTVSCLSSLINYLLRINNFSRKSDIFFSSFLFVTWLMKGTQYFYLLYFVMIY